jgi:hypothetical protein
MDSQNKKIVYNEVDFILPVHRFNIRFTYVTKKGFPFIREFILRLVHISPMQPAQIGVYFGLSRRELDEALSDLMDKGDLLFTPSGQVTLTAQSRGYFVGLGSTPLLSTILETGAALSFELSRFGCIGRGRTNDRWNSGIKLKIDNQAISQSENLARTAFQHQFYEILDKGYLPSVREEGKSRPSIYTIDSVSKLGQEPLRLTTKFYIDLDGKPVERSDYEALDDSSSVQELVTNAISEQQKNTNIPQLAEAMNVLGDNWTRILFNNNSISAEKLLQVRAEALLNDKPIPFIGQIYSSHNWEVLTDKLSSILKRINKIKNSACLDLIWVAPSDAFWGKSNRLNSCFSELVSDSYTKEKNARQLYSPMFFLPLQDKADRFSANQWKSDFKDSINNLYGIVEGFLNGDVEVILLKDELVVVNYHFTYPSALPVSIPVGFISTDKAIVIQIQEVVNKYLNSLKSSEQPNNIGPLKNVLEK